MGFCFFVCLFIFLCLPHSVAQPFCIKSIIIHQLPLVWITWCRRIKLYSYPQEQTFRWHCLPQWPIKHCFHYYLCVGIWMWVMPFSFCFIHKHISKCQSKSLEKLLIFGVKMIVPDSMSNFWSCSSEIYLYFSLVRITSGRPSVFFVLFLRIYLSVLSHTSSINYVYLIVFLN